MRLELIDQDKLDQLYPKLFNIDGTGLYPVVLPWTWLGDDLFESMPDTRFFNWPNKHMAGYCLPASEPVELNGEYYWASLVAYYLSVDDSRYPKYGIQYGLYIECGDRHMFHLLTGWQHYVYEGKLMTSLLTGIVDRDNHVIYRKYGNIKAATSKLIDILVKRELASGANFLSCVANHHRNALAWEAASYAHDLPAYSILSDIDVPMAPGEKLSDFIEGK